MTSWGQADITMMQSMSARKTRLSPGFETVSRHSRSPLGSTGMFIHRLKDAGHTGEARPSDPRARWRLSAQLAWPAAQPSFAYRAGSQGAMTVSCTPGEVADSKT